MLGLFKNLFGKKTEEAPARATPQEEPKPQTKPVTQANAPAQPVQSPSSPTPSFQKIPLPTGPSLSIPLKSLVSKIPNEITGGKPPKIKANSEVTLPKSRVLAQLPQGIVRFSYAEIYSWASDDGLPNCEGFEQTLIDIPLAEILPKLGKSDLSMKVGQQETLIPGEISDFFGPKGGRPTAPVAPPQRSSPPPSQATPAPITESKPGSNLKSVPSVSGQHASLPVPEEPRPSGTQVPTSVPDSSHEPRPTSPVTEPPLERNPLHPSLLFL